MSTESNAHSVSRPVSAWTELWHVWFVIIPRRTITGRLAYGNVWRRWDGRRWIYKRMTQCDA
ncbi:hypothetical protein ABIB66_002503 [Bradyrhizobium sp. F1.13.3]